MTRRDHLASFFLLQNNLVVDGIYYPQDHVVPYDCELVRVWGNIGASVPPGGALDLLMDLTRARDGFTLARFRDDHYAPPTGLRAITESWTFDPERAPVLRAGETLTTAIRCGPASGGLPVWASAFFALELTVWKL